MSEMPGGRKQANAEIIPPRIPSLITMPDNSSSVRRERNPPVLVPRTVGWPDNPKRVVDAELSTRPITRQPFLCFYPRDRQVPTAKTVQVQ